MLTPSLSFKSERKSYHSLDLVMIFQAIDHEKQIRVTKRSSLFRPVSVRYPTLKLSTIQRYYQKWVDQNRPQTQWYQLNESYLTIIQIIAKIIISNIII
jgi:hypothetical protein